VLLYHPDDLEVITAKRVDGLRYDLTPESQSACGYLSGIVRGVKCIERVIAGAIPDDRYGRRTQARAKHALIKLAGLLEESRRDDARSMLVLRRDNYWLGSVIRKCLAFRHKALFWNRGNMLDAPYADFHAIGLEVLGVAGNESMDELLAIFRSHFGLTREPPSSSNPPHVDTSEVLEDQEGKPVEITKQPEYNLTYAEYAALKRICRPSDLRIAAGRLGGYKKRGDLAGFAATIDQIREGKRLTVGGNRTGVREKKPRMGGYVTEVMTKALVGASCAMEVASRIFTFYTTGEL
jgi:hypothetical protein